MLDCEYVQFWSLGNELKIVVQTFGAVIAGRGAY
jgi:lipopolysaccharide/colanic/teichoic acid biosynthesis glycosyltransferase